jgi:hypothetical protein
VINTREKIAKQVVLQENDQPIKYPMFKELRTHLMSMKASGDGAAKPVGKSVMQVSELPISTRVELI